MEYIFFMFLLLIIVVIYISKMNKEDRRKNMPHSKQDKEDDVDPEVRRLVKGRRRSAAIKKYRKDHGGSLMNAKRHIDDMDDK